MSRVPKTHPRIEAYGDVDELNAQLGVALATRGLPEPYAPWLRAHPERPLRPRRRPRGARPADDGKERLRVAPAQVTWLEERCDEVNATLRAAALLRPAGRHRRRPRSCTSAARSAGAPSAARCSSRTPTPRSSATSTASPTCSSSSPAAPTTATSRSGSPGAGRCIGLALMAATRGHRGRGARPRVQGRPAGGRRHRPRRSRPARSTASSGPTAPASPRRCSCSRRCCRPPPGTATRGRPRRRAARAPAVRASIGAALQEAALDPFLTGREHMRLQAALHGLPRGERRAARRRAARARRPHRGGRPQGRRLLGRHEAPPRPRARARAPAARSSSSTSRRPASTRRAAARCGRRSRASRATTA